MRPVEPDPAQRRRDLRLAWILIGCSGALTLVLLVAGLIALRAPLARWSASLATSNASTSAAASEAEAHKEAPDADAREGDLSGDNAADLPSAAGELQKRPAGEAGRDEEDGDEDSVRRGGGDRPPPRTRSDPEHPGTIA